MDDIISRNIIFCPKKMFNYTDLANQPYNTSNIEVQIKSIQMKLLRNHLNYIIFNIQKRHLNEASSGH